MIGATLFVIWQVRPNLIFANTTPTGLDLGGHVWEAAFLRDHLLPGHLSGWSPDMFGGVPAYVLYPVLPAVFVVIVGLLFPYGVALKLIVVAGVVLLPAAAWALGKLTRLTEPAPAVLAVAVLPFLFDTSYHAYGGNLQSSVAGEFSYGLGMLFFVVALGLLDVVCRTGRWRAPAALAMGLCALCHPVTGLVVFGAGVILVAFHTWRTGRHVLRRALPVGVVAGLVSAFWLLPFAWYRHELTNTVNLRQTNWASLFFPMPGVVEVVVMALVIVAVIGSVRSRQPFAMALVAVLVLSAIGVLVLPAGVLVNARLVPIWHLTRWLLAGLGAVEVLHRVAPHFPRFLVAGPIGCLAVVVFMFGINTGSLPGTTVSRVETANGPVQRSKWLFLPSVATSLDPVLVQYGFGGYERYFNHAAYQDLIATMRSVGSRLGCGRAFDEFDPSTLFGSIYQLSILPYWTNGCIDGMAGVSPDQSRNTPFILDAQEALSYQIFGTKPRQLGLNVADGVAMLRDLGVRYYLAWSQPAQAQADHAAGLQLVATSGQWKIYQVQGTSIVQSLSTEPVVVPAGSKELVWDQVATRWMTAPASAAPPAVDGPAAWPRANDPAAARERPIDQPATVSDVHVGISEVSFHVNRIGTPVVVRISDFPWWQAHGANGPWRVAPDNMVVVPTKNDVVLTAAPRLADHVGEGLSLVGLAGLIALAFTDWRIFRPNRDELGLPPVAEP